MEIEIQKNLKYNYWINVLDGGFFGAAVGFASFSTVLPLFVSTMTDSAILIGLIPAIHTVGWQFPQLLTAERVSRLRHFKPVVLFFTIQERIPFLGLAIVALLLGRMSTTAGLWITFFLLIWQGLGGGVTANAWQSMINKIIPGEIRATFFGSQSAAANFLAGAGAVTAGLIIDKVSPPFNYSLCFFIASIFMAVSWAFISAVREPVKSVDATSEITIPFWSNVRRILRNDRGFRWYLITRMLTQFAIMSFAFYTVYAVRILHMSPTTAGILTSVLLVTQVVANPILGRIADRWSHKYVLELGAVAAVMSSILAWLTSSASWFYVVIILEGITLVTYWTIGLAMTLEFGTEDEKPVYIGLANTLLTPFTVVAPIIGGGLADAAGYQATFFVSAVAGIVTAAVLHFLVRDPKSVLVSLSISKDD